MERPNLQRMFLKLNAKHFSFEIPPIPVVWNRRLTTTAGICRYCPTPSGGYAPKEITLSEKLFRSLGYPLDKVERTLIHEMTHAYLLHKYDEKGHTRRFQNVMTRITGENINHRCHTYDTSAVRMKRSIEMHCTRCGLLGTRARMPRSHSSTSVYRHSGCRGTVTLWRMK